MYGKIFGSMYDGTLAGHWQAIVTMQQLIVLASPDGVVDMTPNAIAGRTTIPLEIIQAGLKKLAEPDPRSRTPGDDGKRIVLLDDHRDWGWRLVNHGKYMRLRNVEQKREADRVRIQEKRKKINGVAIPSQDVANVAHSDTDSDKEKAFPQFWASYPRKDSKQESLKAFLKLKNGDVDRVMAALEKHKKSAQWASDGGKFIPHASTWLNQRRFEDELAPAAKPYTGP